MKRDKKNTEFATDEPTQQSNIKKPNEREEHTELPRPHEEDLIINEKKGKSTSL